MEEQTNNVGGSNMGMAPLGPGAPVAGQTQGGVVPAQGAQLPAGFYSQQLPGMGAQTDQSGAAQATNDAKQNNNDVSTTSAPASAEDSDLIEKEWVEKAKAIVEKTRRDPYLQSQELSQLKMDYLQKRYGKNVGSGEY